MAQKTTKPKTKKPPIKKIIIFIWFLFLVGLLAIGGIFMAAKKGYLGEMPEVEELENPDIYVSSQIISSDGVLVDRFEAEKRIPITYEDLPQHLVDALLAKEDIRYREHSGIDGRATLRAITSMGESGGGSTITQQLAKQLFSGARSKNKFEAVKQKIKEWVVAVELEKRYTKDEIIAMYFNKFDFLYGAKGVESAAKIYFNTTTSKLTVDQSAMLVAMFRSPWLYNPFRKPENAIQKRNLVIDQMVKYNKLSPQEGETYKNKPLGLDRQEITTVGENYSAYYKHALRKEIEAWFKEYEKETGKKYNLYKDGLKIYITIDSRMQKLAEEAAAKHLKNLQKTFFREQKYNKNAPFYKISKAKAERIFEAAMRRTQLYKKLKEEGRTEEQILAEFNRKRDSVKTFTWDGVKYEKNMSLMDSIKYHKHILQTGLMSMDPKDGTIKAWVGGINWDYFKFDHVHQARRQVGSTFKPFVYVTAINQMNYTPCNTISNARFQVGNWKPGNANGKYGGAQDLRTALAFSTNVITARLIAQTGVDPVIKLAKEMGVESNIPRDYTIALGSADLTVYEMVGALSTFANRGIYTKPELILRIEDRQGKVIKDFKPESREVVNEYVAYAMLDLMEGVVNRGTAKWIRSKYGIKSQIAGKTGTTNDNSDGWFMGLTPNLVTGVWVGAEDRFAHFRSTGQGQGAATALPIWAYYMKEVYKNGKEFGVLPSDKFEKPKDIDEKWDCASQTGFHTYGSMGGVIDSDTRTHTTTQHTTTQHTTQSVNNNQSGEDDAIDFDQ